MTDATYKISFGGKLAEQLKPYMNERMLSNDPISQSLASKFQSSEVVARGGGVQFRVNITLDEARYFIEDVNSIWELHYAKSSTALPKENRNRLVWVQANRTRKQLVEIDG